MIIIYIIYKLLFNFKNKTIPIFCGIHKKIAMSNILKTLCEDKNCISEAFYNTIGESKPLFCRKHKKTEMQNIIKKLCQHPNCKKIPVFGYTTNNKKLYCVQHKLETMENLDCKKCQEYGCLKLASFNYEGQKYGIYCEEHKKENMKNVRKHKCIEEGCVRQANYNLKNKQPMWCRIHKSTLMINVTNKLCEHPSCEKVPSFNYINEKKSILCSEHKLPDMINVAGKICKTPNCTITIRNNKNDKYKGYCLFCFIHTFPDEQVVRNYKTKEKHITYAVKIKFPEQIWISDKIISGGCSKKRPDMFLDFGSHVIIIEIDENQHGDYNCENKRIMELSKDVNHRPIIMVRFNPDNYIRNKIKITSCWRYNQNGSMSVKNCKKDEWKMRLNTLSQTIDYWLENKSEKTIHIIHLFYDTE